MKNALTAPITAPTASATATATGMGTPFLTLRIATIIAESVSVLATDKIEIARSQREDEAEREHDDDRIEAEHRGIGRPGEHGRSHEAEPDDQHRPGGKQAEFLRRRR